MHPLNQCACPQNLHDETDSSEYSADKYGNHIPVSLSTDLIVKCCLFRDHNLNLASQSLYLLAYRLEEVPGSYRTPITFRAVVEFLDLFFKKNSMMFPFIFRCGYPLACERVKHEVGR